MTFLLLLLLSNLHPLQETRPADDTGTYPLYYRGKEVGTETFSFKTEEGRRVLKASNDFTINQGARDIRVRVEQTLT